MFIFRFIANKWLSPIKDDKKLFVELNHRVPSPPRNMKGCELNDIHLCFLI